MPELNFSGLAIAALKESDFSLLIGSNAEDALNSSWGTLQIAIRWYARETKSENISVVVPDSLEWEEWAIHYCQASIARAQTLNATPPEFLPERVDDVILILLVQTHFILSQLAQHYGATTEEVIEKLQEDYLTAAALRALE